MDEINPTNKLYVLEQDLDKGKVEETLEGMDVDEMDSEVAIVVESEDGAEYYFEGEDEAPEGMSYEEDGLLKVTAEKNGTQFQYSEAEQSEKGDSDLILTNTDFDKRFMLKRLLSGHDEDDVGPYIFLEGDEMWDFYAAFKPFTNPELVKGAYHLKDDRLCAEEGEPEADINVNGHKVSVRGGGMKVVCKNEEVAEEIFEEVVQVLQEDDDWPPELEWYRRVATGKISVSDDVEVEEREEEVLKTHTFYDIALDDGRNVSFMELDDEMDLMLGQSKEGHEDAKQALEDVEEVDGVEVELEDEGGLRDSLKFENYEYPE